MHNHKTTKTPPAEHPAQIASSTPSAAAETERTTYRISTMDCPAEESELRRTLEPIAGVRGLHFSLDARTLAIEAPAAILPEVVKAIRGAGFQPEPLESSSQRDRPRNWIFEQPLRLGTALVLALVAELANWIGGGALAFTAVSMLLAAAAIALSGFSTYSKGLSSLRHGRLNINGLMSVAVTGAFLIGQWPEAAVVMALYAIAELIETRAVDRARNAISGLLDLTPETADVQQPREGGWLPVAVHEVSIGTIVRVKPGARIPLDGVVTAGTSSVNQAPVTGESLPVEKAVGDSVYAGTINLNGSLEVRVTASAGNTTLARIIQAVEQAQGSRAPTQRFVDRFAMYYTPAVFALSVAVAALTPWLMGWSVTQAVYKALVLLVIACPCALVIATPVTIVSGLAAAARRGILIKGGIYLEMARRLRVIALDKTGTVTEGKPKLVASEALVPADQVTKVFRQAADLASHSDHPISMAIASGLPASRGKAEDFKALPGRGVEALVDGEVLTLGNHRLIEERGICGPAIEARLAEHEAQGRTVTMLASKREVLAIFAVADTIRETSSRAIEELHALGITSVMLTGDNTVTAQSIARLAGIDDVRGNLLPEDKAQALRELQAQYGPAAMAGDGINDAPALAQADIGVAMGGVGTDTAMETADIIIMNDDLRRVPEAVRLSQRTRRILVENISLALGIKAVFLAFALFGSATMWMAVFADMGASFLVVLNGLRMLRAKHPA